MAVRPVYIAKCSSDRPKVEKHDVEFEWIPGLSTAQKQKSIQSLHESASQIGIGSILEVSSKSRQELGVRLSAFNLKTDSEMQLREVPVEVAFQSAKVFRNGGPYADLLSRTPREAKNDPRLKGSGDIVGFEIAGIKFPATPVTFFYDWIYIRALNSQPNLSISVLEHNSFTDIEFNPGKSKNCQAYSCALFVSLKASGYSDEALESPSAFMEIMSDEYAVEDQSEGIQMSLI